MESLERSIKLGEVKAEVKGTLVKLTGPKGEVEREFREKVIEISSKDNSLFVNALSPNRNAKRIMNSSATHLRNMVKGVTEGYEYRLKICSGHFPMNVSVSGKEITIKNFIGEKSPRKCIVKGDVNVKLEKDILVLGGIDKETVGQAAADIEQATKIRGKDRRIFMDGIYIISKGQNE